MKLAAEIAERLADSAEQISAMLLAGGKREGNFWTAGDTSGASGQSLKVYLTGGKRGRWTDYATGEHGDLLDLWAAHYGLSILEAMKEAASWCGIQYPEFREPERKFTKPEPKYTALTDAHREWLHGRGLADEVIDKFQIGSKGNAIALPFFRDGELANVKYREPKPRKEAKLWAESNCIPCLYGWQALDPKSRQVCIVEGEFDALAMTQYGMPSLSVPNGGGRKQAVWIENEFDRLAQFDRVFLAMDDDDEGRAAAEEIMDRLGPERCRLVELPFKDANECLERGVRREVMRECFRHSRSVDPEELKRPEDFRKAVQQEFHGTPVAEIGFAPPFASMHETLRFRPGEVIVLAGPNGSGKSQYAGQQTLEAMRHDFKSCIASMEFRPSRYLKRMARQAGAVEEPSEQYLDAIISDWNEKLWIFSVTGTAKRERMLDVFRYARRKYGIRLFVIDNLAKCGFAEDDYNGQKSFVDQLTDFAKDTDSIVLLVHHMRKGGEDKDGIKGTGAITDMVDTVLIIWRNKAKEDALRELAEDDERREKFINQPDGKLMCRKQRNYEGVDDGEPQKSMWFDRVSYQFLGGPNCRPYQYVRWSNIHKQGAA